MTFFEHRRSVDSMKRFYNWFNRFYGGIEKNIGKFIAEIVDKKIALFPGVSSDTALEYCCGTGAMTLEIAKVFKFVDGKDLSKGMLDKAGQRINDAELTNVKFAEGNILNPLEPPKSYDYVLVSFALHLFSPENEKKILENFINIARKAVVIIDHGKKWGLMTAFIEWIEGSFYDKFIKLDFQSIAKDIGAKEFEESEIADSSVMIFRC
jgi:ubiquinone/menaquinone biosynthesis C-methylase UbiE